MAQGARETFTKDVYEFIQELRDFLVDCGWSDETPAAQDDELGAALGYLLHSDGEDGNRDIWIHLFHSHDTYRRGPAYYPWFSYLATQITPSSTEFDVDDASGVAGDTDFMVKVGTEQIRIASVSGNTLYISQRGVAQTPIGTHNIDAQIADLSGVYPWLEVYALADWTNPIVTASGTAACTTTSCPSVPGLSGYEADKFSYGSMVKMTGSGKMRRVTDYNASNGTFTCQPFKDAPGTETVGVLSQGFMPCMSERSTASSNTSMQGRMTYSAWRSMRFYGDKNGVYVVSHMPDGYYWGFHAGEPVIFAARDNAELASAASAGDTSIEVDNRHLFRPDGVYRIVSQTYADWEPNNARPSPEPDLDPEDLPNEFIYVHSITPGVGDKGTLGLSWGLTHGYSIGAVVGELPRPAGRTGFIYDMTGDYARLLTDDENSESWIPCFNWLPYTWIGSNGGRYRRHFWRSVATDASPWTPVNNNQLKEASFSATPQMGVEGEEGNNPYYANNPNRLADRFTFGRIILTQNVWNATYDQAYGIMGSLPNIFHATYSAPGQIPGGVAAEDLFDVPWGTGVEKFRLFPIRWSPYSGPNYERYVLFGPEITVP